MELHKQKGLNPRMGICPNCGKDNGEIILLGARTRKRECRNCGTVNYGSRPSDMCGRCSSLLDDATMTEIDENERIPGSLCARCKTEKQEMKEEVEAGGVYWKCKCGATGVIKRDSEIAKQVREASKIAAPGLVGYQSDACHNCEKEKV